MQEKDFNTSKQNVSFQVGSTRLGKKVIEVQGIKKSYEGKELIHDFDYLVVPGERLGIIGPNGSGKTTLLNIMAERVLPDQGEVEIGETVKIGYYTQGEEELDTSMRVIDYIKEVAQVVHTKGGEEITAEQMLERFLFSRPEQWTYISRLSGGETRRLYLLKVLMTEPNVLFLDEPTNDLDTQTLGVLEEYLDQFPGVVITVSHDRYFLDRVVDHLLVFKNNESIERYQGNYSEFLEHETEQKESRSSVSVKEKPRKQQNRKKMSYKDQKEWETIEDEITELEAKIEEIQEGINNAGSDLEKVQKFYEQQQEVEDKLQAKMERWEELSVLVEEIEGK